jgi:hypothetical protein
MDAARRFRRSVAANSAGERELLEETLHPFHVFSLIRIDLGVGAFEVALGQYRRGPVTRAGNVDRVQVVLVDKPVEVNVGETLAGVGAPVPQHARLDVSFMAFRSWYYHTFNPVHACPPDDGMRLARLKKTWLREYIFSIVQRDKFYATKE